MIEIGSFEVTSGKLRVTDPCYDRDTRCAGTIENALKGWWNASVVKTDGSDGWGRRCATLIVQHKSYYFLPESYKWVKTGIDVGVDSGQAGVFEDSLYPHGETGEYGDTTTFYGRACNQSIDKDGCGTAGVIAEGAVSSSGYGDGSYDCYTITEQDGTVIAVKIEFLCEYEDDFEDEEENVED